jgi:hypothetical protein
MPWWGMAYDSYKPLPFYQPYTVFDRAMVYWKKNGAPKRFTSVALRAGLGNEGGRLLAGFIGLGWIVDSIGTPSSDLKALIDAYGTDAWKPTLRKVLERTYSYIPGDWAELTPEKLSAAILKHAGRPSGALVGAETFFLTAASEAGILLPDAFIHRTARARPKSFGAAEDELEFTSISDAQPPSKKVNGAGRDPVSELLALFDRATMSEKEKDALLILLTHLSSQNPHDRSRQQ